MQYDNAQAMMEQQLNLLKYIIDYPAGEAIALTPVDTENNSCGSDRAFGKPVRTAIAAIAKATGRTTEEMIDYGYLPSLSLTGSWMFPPTLTRLIIGSIPGPPGGGIVPMVWGCPCVSPSSMVWTSDTNEKGSCRHRKHPPGTGEYTEKPANPIPECHERPDEQPA